VLAGPSMKRGSCEVLMASRKVAVMTPSSWLEEYVSDPISAYWHCQLETNSEEKPVVRSPQTSPGEGLRNRSGLLPRLHDG
jgi:hypothetical protein